MFIRKAERKKAKLRLGLSGASGSGKTWSALEIAFGMLGAEGKIGMIDTESGRGDLYADMKSKYNADLQFNYDVIRLEKPFSPARYAQAIKTFEKAGYDLIIIDSLSHAWTGEGGVLDIVDGAGGQFQKGWKQGTPAHNSLIEAVITSKCHIISTFRAKTEYIVQLNSQGKQAPMKMGLAPIQRDGMEYEYTVFINMAESKMGHITKDNTGTLEEFVKPSPELGVKIMAWLNQGTDPKKFTESIMPQLIEQISSCNTIDELQHKFAEFYNLYGRDNLEAFKQVMKAKDDRKEFLQSKIPAMVAAKKTFSTSPTITVNSFGDIPQ